MSLEYNKAVSQLLSLADFERKSRANDPTNFHLKRVERLLQYLGNPHQGQKYIHVAGSKGKGSTSALIAWSLAGTGYKTGLFTSPSIHKITERFRINGVPISEKEFSDLITKLWPAVEQVKSDNDISQTHLQDKQNYRSKLKGKNCRFAHNWRIDIGISSYSLCGT